MASGVVTYVLIEPGRGNESESTNTMDAGRGVDGPGV